MDEHSVGTYGKPKIYNWGGIYDHKAIIGKYCSIADNVTIIVDGNHRTDWITTYPFAHTGHPEPTGNVIIGNDVWIGYGAIILANSIGDGAVVGAGSVVVKDVRPYEIVAGNPARHIRFRFDQETIDRLLADPWWEWDDDKIQANLEVLCNKP